MSASSRRVLGLLAMLIVGILPSGTDVSADCRCCSAQAAQERPLCGLSRGTVRDWNGHGSTSMPKFRVPPAAAAFSQRMRSKNSGFEHVDGRGPVIKRCNMLTGWINSASLGFASLPSLPAGPGWTSQVTSIMTPP
jgi:hypothetical protein